MRSLGVSARGLLVLKARLHRLVRENQELSAENSTLKTDLRSHFNAAEKLLRQLNADQENRMHDSEARADRLQATCATQESEIFRLKTALRESEAYRTQLRRDLSLTGAEIAHVRQQVVAMAAAFEDQLAHVRSVTDEKISRTVTHLEEKVSRLSRVSFDAENRCADLKTRLQALDTYMRDEERKHREVRDMYLEMQQRARHSEVGAEEQKSKIHELSMQCSRLSDERDAWERKAVQWEADVRMLKEAEVARENEISILREQESARKIEFERLEARMADVSRRCEKSLEAVLRENEELKGKLTDSESQQVSLLEAVSKHRAASTDLKNQVESLKRECRVLESSSHDGVSRVAQLHARVWQQINLIFASFVAYASNLPGAPSAAEVQAAAARDVNKSLGGESEVEAEDPLYRSVVHVRYVSALCAHVMATDREHGKMRSQGHFYESTLERLCSFLQFSSARLEEAARSPDLEAAAAKLAAEIAGKVDAMVAMERRKVQDITHRYETEIENILLAQPPLEKYAQSAVVALTSESESDRERHDRSGRPAPRVLDMSPEEERAERHVLSDMPPKRGQVVEIHHHHHYDASAIDPQEDHKHSMQMIRSSARPASGHASPESPILAPDAGGLHGVNRSRATDVSPPGIAALQEILRSISYELSSRGGELDEVAQRVHRIVTDRDRPSMISSQSAHISPNPLPSASSASSGYRKRP